MCDPVTIAGIGLTAGSYVVNNMAAAKVDNARADAMAAENIRQRELEQQAAAVNANSQDLYKDFGDKQDAKATTLADFFTGQALPVDEVNAAAALPASTNNIVVNEENRQREKARAYTDQQGQSLGKLRSFGDLIGETGRSQSRDAREIGQIGGFQRGSSNVLPYELDAANHKGDGLKLFGDILGGAGTVTSTYAATQGGVPVLGTTEDPWKFARSLGKLPRVPRNQTDLTSWWWPTGSALSTGPTT